MFSGWGHWQSLGHGIFQRNDFMTPTYDDGGPSPITPSSHLPLQLVLFCVLLFRREALKGEKSAGDFCLLVPSAICRLTGRPATGNLSHSSKTKIPLTPHPPHTPSPLLRQAHGCHIGGIHQMCIEKNLIKVQIESPLSPFGGMPPVHQMQVQQFLYLVLVTRHADPTPMFTAELFDFCFYVLQM